MQRKLIDIYFYQAGCGDAARIFYQGSDGKLHNIFIDAGYERTFRTILKSAFEEASSIDLWVISHIHDDHIGGAIAYLNAIKIKETEVEVMEWVYNPPRLDAYPVKTKQAVSTLTSIRQADILWDHIIATQRQAANEVTNETLVRDIYGIKLSYLTPSVEKLQKLREKYSKPEIAFERQEDTAISNARVARTANDYYKKLEDFDLDIWEEDHNIENGSCISVLTDLDGLRVLWLADAHPIDIIAGLEKYGFTNDNPLVCDLVKVPHHGSRGNNNNALYDHIRCAKYIFSVNGENIHQLPHKEVLSRILRNKFRNISLQPYTFFFTYDNATLRSILDIDGPDVFTRFNFKMVYSDAQYIKNPQLIF